jgi:hypothetical protein
LALSSPLQKESAMMFKFYQPQKKEQKVSEIKVIQRDETIIIDDGKDLLGYLTHLEAAALSTDLAQAVGIDVTLTTACKCNPSTDDPALLLAQRIASISAETGLKPGLVYSIVCHIRWDSPAHVLEVEAPQENLTDG